jgi:hypothetical protein
VLNQKGLESRKKPILENRPECQSLQDLAARFGAVSVCPADVAGFACDSAPSTNSSPKELPYSQPTIFREHRSMNSAKYPNRPRDVRVASGMYVMSPTPSALSSSGGARPTEQVRVVAQAMPAFGGPGLVRLGLNRTKSRFFMSRATHATPQAIPRLDNSAAILLAP